MILSDRLAQALTLFRVFVSPKPHIAYPAPETLVIEPSVDAEVKRQTDNALLVSWTPDAASATIYAGTQPDAIDDTKAMAIVNGSKEVTLTGLDPAVRYYFEIALTGGPHGAERLKVAERILPLPHAINFRDIGGYRTKDGRHVRWGRVYRSGYFTRLTESDYRYMQAIGLKLDCDLRSSSEMINDPDKLPPNSGIKYQPLPLMSDKESADGLRLMMVNIAKLEALVTDSYTHDMIDRKAQVFGEALRSLTENTPAVVHCTAGKDRTGITMALLLGLLGVPDDVIIADYSISNRFYADFREGLLGAERRLGFFRITLNDLMPLLSANPTTMRAALAYIRQNYESIEGYLTAAAGLDTGTLSHIKDTMLE